MSVSDSDVFAMKDAMNDDLSFEKTFSMNGRRLGAIDIQRIFLEVMREYEIREGVTADTKEALGRFELLLNKFTRSIYQEEREVLLMPECDWAAKRVLVRQDALRYGYSMYDPPQKFIEVARQSRTYRSTVKNRIQLLDLYFHDMRRTHGLHYALEKKGLRERILDDPEIDDAVFNPPPNTRAAWRKWWQDQADREELKITHWDWTDVRAYRQRDECVFDLKNKNPFESNPRYQE